MTGNRGGRGTASNTGLLVLIGVLCVVVVVLVAGLIVLSNRQKQPTGPIIGGTTLQAGTTPDGSGTTPDGSGAIPDDPGTTPNGSGSIGGTTGPTTPPSSDYKLVTFTGRVEHVFTHSLVAFPELAYVQTNKADLVRSSYFVDCITVKEFKAVLEALYRDGYMLININDTYEAVEENGKTTFHRKTSFQFPEGKKPLVFSFDDTVYDPRKAGNGMVDKLVLQNGKVVSYTKMKDGREIYSDDNEFVPILDRFVEEHPDFSFNGAKGMICLTGFTGILGYRTQRVQAGDGRTEAQRQAEIEAVKPVIQALKDTGWYFGSHSYKHGNMQNYSEASMRDCAQKFQDEVIPLIGPTKIYIYPYGSWSRPVNGAVPATQAVLNSFGFEYFCSVGVNMYVATRNDLGGVILQDRANIDGASFMRHQDLFTQHKDPNLGTDRFPSLVFRDIWDDARGISYDEAVAVYSELLG